MVRRVRDANHQDPLFPVWRHHPFFTNSDRPRGDADITQRSFAASDAGAICAGITYNLLRVAGSLAGAGYAVARGATLRRHLVNVPARLGRPQRKTRLHLRAHWPWARTWLGLWNNVFPAAAT